MPAIDWRCSEKHHARVAAWIGLTVAAGSGEQPQAFDDLWTVFCAADHRERQDLLEKLLRVIHENGLTAEQLQQLSTMPGLQFLTERELVDGAVLPACRQAEPE